MKPSFVAALGAGMALPAFGLLFRYRRDMNAARARLAPWTATSSRRNGGRSSMPSRVRGTRCSSCMGSFTTASADCLKYAISLPIVASSLRRDSAISARACRRTRRRPPRPTRSPLCSTAWV